MMSIFATGPKSVSGIPILEILSKSANSSPGTVERENFFMGF